jgi:hypothetical protein
MDEQVIETVVEETSLLKREETVTENTADVVEETVVEETVVEGPSVPETVDGYEYTPSNPDAWNEAEYNSFKEKALEMGLNTEQFNNALSAYEESMLSIVEQYTQTPEKAESVLQEKWGKNYDSNMRDAQKAFNQLVPKDFDEKIGNNPDVIEILAHIGKQLQEDNGSSNLNTGTKSNGMSKLEIEEYMKAPDYWTNKEKQKIVQAWYESR